MAVWASGVLLLVGVTVVAGSCPAGRYGNICSYYCHCPDNCNPTSGCHPASCSRGWSGRTCQKENVALNKITSSSSVHYSSSNAVNGDETRCFHSAYNNNTITSAWWRVDLGEGTMVHDVIIYFRTDYKVRRNGIQIYIADIAASPTDGVNCYNVTGNRDGTDIPDVLKVTCSGEGRYLVLYTTTVNNDNVNVPILDFCEVEVDVCAPGTFGADCENYCHCDGDVCNYVAGVCPSGVCLPGWQTDTCDRVCGVGSYGKSCIKVCSDRHCKDDNSTCDHVTGECVGGCEAGWNGADCTEKCVNFYGESCAYLCSSRKCNGISSCNHVTGECERGCVPGWKHIDCTEACIQGVEYGANCSGNCSARMCEVGNATCPQDSGRCENGCHPGWKGEDCTTVCGVGRYGTNCSKLCSDRHCKGDNSSCDHVTGQCVGGCEAGWDGTDCTETCIQGVEYGAKCSGNCSARKCEGGNDACPQDSGRCENGCQSGFKGEDCTQACVQGMEYGVGCLKTCSTRMCQGDTSTCPRDTGRCTDGCQAGWRGKDCTTACVQGMEYGVGCAKLCSTRMCQGATSTCPQDTGRCTDGCQAGWKGEDCTTEISKPLSASPAVIAGVVVAAIAVVAMVAVVVVLLRRRSHRKQSDNHSEIHKEDPLEMGVDNPVPVLRRTRTM
ncbi:multiple epidermal growth factor-like domains protein 10 isoform X1 [Haliotis rubra]|uniref:multiple epidermal growth factor-like domains protein 10 isoform X1 n=1 Tax=Haliotis rubra TaxID=36100 RepID=UPI001EE61D09|nr:multiple epidermal growth factor-like domains protein 10 isoform X1 [Haliotis rubra]